MNPLPNLDSDWFLTYTGLQFYPLNAKPEQVCIEDIARSLSCACRFNGACLPFYSVAEHSLMVCDILPKPLKLLGLMHDAAEAYCGDMVRPLKEMMPEFQLVEQHIWRAAIAPKFGLTPEMSAFPPEIKRADNIALMTERRDLLKPTGYTWRVKEQPLPATIRPVAQHHAEEMFLYRFRQLTRS